MLVSAVSVLVVAQSSSEIPEGLMNNPVYCISIVRSFYFKILSATFLITFLPPGIATSINIHVPFSLSRVTTSGLLLGMVLSVCTCWFHSMVTLPPRLVSSAFGTCSYQCFFV
jgi:hypothetical protein